MKEMINDKKSYTDVSLDEIEIAMREVKKLSPESKNRVLGYIQGTIDANERNNEKTA